MHILKHGGTPILISHFGRPGGKVNDKYSMRHIVPAVKDVLKEYGRDLHFLAESIGPEGLSPYLDVKENEVNLLENHRFTKHNEHFTRQLAAMCDGGVIREDFAGMHRPTSFDELARMKGARAFGGFLLEREIRLLSPFTDNLPHPFSLFWGGGPKFLDKLVAIKELLEKMSGKNEDKIYLIAGALKVFLEAKLGFVTGGAPQLGQLDELRTFLMAAHRLSSQHATLP
jgi:phosphoglycerate kinase